MSLTLPAGASAAGSWGKVSTDDTSAITTPSLALAGSTVVGAWPRVVGATRTAETDAFTPDPSGSKLAASVKRTNVTTGWSGLYTWIFTAAAAPGGLQTMLSGTQDNVPTNPLNGTSFAQRNADGSWAAPISSGLFGGATSSSAAVAIAGPDNQTPLYVFDYGGGLTVFAGATGQSSSPGTSVGATQLGGAVEATGPRLGRDSAGRYWLTWYNSREPTGIYLLQLDPATGQPIGSAGLAPQSKTGANFGDGRFAIACNSTCRVVYHEGDASGNATPRLLTWAFGEPSATVVTGPSDTGGAIAAAARSDGRVWVAWYDLKATAFKAVLGDGKGAGGGAQNIGRPAPKGDAEKNAAIAAPDGSLVLATNWLDNTTAMDAFWALDVPAVYAGPTRESSGTVGDTVLTLVTPKSCVPTGSTIVAKLFVKASKTKRKAHGKGRLKVKVRQVDFSLDGAVKVHDKRKAFAATITLTGAKPGSTHALRAKVFLKVKHGPPRSRSIRSSFKVCA
jgi:hypothetical protein